MGEGSLADELVLCRHTAVAVPHLACLSFGVFCRDWLALRRLFFLSLFLSSPSPGIRRGLRQAHGPRAITSPFLHLIRCSKYLIALGDVSDCFGGFYSCAIGVVLSGCWWSRESVSVFLGLADVVVVAAAWMRVPDSG